MICKVKSEKNEAQGRLFWKVFLLCYTLSKVMGIQYGKAINSIINLIVIVIFVYAFLNAEARARIIMTAILALLFILPAFFSVPALYWVCYAGKVIFGLSCYLYIKGKGATI